MCTGGTGVTAVGRRSRRSRRHPPRRGCRSGAAINLDPLEALNVVNRREDFGLRGGACSVGDVKLLAHVSGRREGAILPVVHRFGVAIVIAAFHTQEPNHLAGRGAPDADHRLSLALFQRIDALDAFGHLPHGESILPFTLLGTALTS